MNNSNVSNKKAGKGNGNSVINNTEKPRNASGNTSTSSSKEKFDDSTKR